MNTFLPTHTGANRRGGRWVRVCVRAPTEREHIQSVLLLVLGGRVCEGTQVGKRGTEKDG